MTAGVWLWRLRLPRRWYGVAVGGVLLLVSPYVISNLGKGITPPADGVSLWLWLTWQLALLVAASALIVPTAALFRGSGPDGAGSWRIFAGVSIAFAAAIIGVLVWSPRGGWPDWYTFLWTPALLLVTLPAPRWAVIGGIALVAGSSAALVTWGAELSGKVQVAQRDVARLGSESDPLAVPLLERFAEQVRRGRPPRTASEMYALWHESSIGTQGYPAHLGLWSSAGAPIDELTLDSLDLPPSLLSSMVRNLAPADTQEVTSLTRVPGVHYVLRVRVTPAEVLTLAVGPRSALIVPGRVGRLLDPAGWELPLYRLTLSPAADPAAPTPRPRWRREGWVLRNEYPLELPGGRRTVHALVELRGPVPLFVRGVLVVLLDAAVLASLWFAAELVSGAQPSRPRWWSLRRSFRMRIAFTLAAFFLLPAIGFAAWSFVRLAEEVQRSRDLLITQTLRDAVLTAGGFFRGDDVQVGEQLRELSRRIDADLALYQGGRLAGASTTVLEDLGVTPQLMDPAAFEALTVGGELEVTRDGSIPKLAERVGYRVIQPGAPSEIGVLATPQLADDSSLAVRQLDLALVLLLATLAGIAGAVAGAQRASRALSRPVADLRRSALALGRGQPVPPRSGSPPLEFEPVFGAFERMAADIASSRHALEEARRRTAAVLATVATGVVGLDPEGRVLIANLQAVELLGMKLEEGDRLLDRLGPEWRPLTAAVGGFLGDPTADPTAELEIGGRRLSLQLSSLGPDVRGVVIALNDVTDVSRAERVLAWGEMARQVAHEIKNPLTPMRLGLQHLRRVYRERREEFDRTLEDTAERMLGEIDRLDTIARAFSRFAAPADDHQPLDRVDLGVVVGEVVQLYRLAEEGYEVRLSRSAASFGAARADEVKEVVVNLLENARNAGAHVVEVTVGPGESPWPTTGPAYPPTCFPGSSSRASPPPRAARVWGWLSCGGWLKAGAGQSRCPARWAGGRVSTSISPARGRSGRLGRQGLALGPGRAQHPHRGLQLAVVSGLASQNRFGSEHLPRDLAAQLLLYIVFGTVVRRPVEGNPRFLDALIQAVPHGLRDGERVVGHGARGPKLGGVGKDGRAEPVHLLAKGGGQQPLTLGARHRSHQEVGHDAAGVRDDPAAVAAEGTRPRERHEETLRRERVERQALNGAAARREPPGRGELDGHFLAQVDRWSGARPCRNSPSR